MASFPWRAGLSFCGAGLLTQVQFPWALSAEKGDVLLGIVLMLQNLCVVLVAALAAVRPERHRPALTDLIPFRNLTPAESETPA